MKASQNCLNIIRKYEGRYITAYKCAAGVWTIGYGHTVGVKKGDTITPLQAEQYLVADVVRFEIKVDKYMDKYNFNQNEFDALVSFAFNVGSIDQLTANGTRSREKIAEKILEYVYAGGRRLSGLERRRKEEHDLFVKPCALLSIEDVAKEVLDGKWGNGSERKEKLTAAGYDYQMVQNCVNSLVRRKT